MRGVRHASKPAAFYKRVWLARRPLFSNWLFFLRSLGRRRKKVISTTPRIQRINPIDLPFFSARQPLTLPSSGIERQLPRGFPATQPNARFTRLVVIYVFQAGVLPYRWGAIARAHAAHTTQTHDIIHAVGRQMFFNERAGRAGLMFCLLFCSLTASESATAADRGGDEGEQYFSGVRIVSYIMRYGWTAVGLRRSNELGRRCSLKSIGIHQGVISKDHLFCLPPYRSRGLPVVSRRYQVFRINIPRAYIVYVYVYVYNTYRHRAHVIYRL